MGEVMNSDDNKVDRQARPPFQGRSFLAGTRRVAAAAAVLFFILALAGAAYQAIAGVLIVVLALADEVHRLTVRKE